MNRSSNAAKSAFLGMSHGTAAGRLRKMVLFRCLQRLGEDVCFQCGKQITDVSQLSLEHKLPWQGRSVELFWDLDNVAFSHLSCNVGAADTTGRGNPNFGDVTRRSWQPGKKYCPGCDAEIDVDLFTNNASAYDGKENYCKVCRKTRRVK